MRVPISAALFLGLCLASRPVAAQNGTAAPAAAPAPVTPWGAKPTGTYALVADVGGMPHAATLKMATDSLGATRATVESEGETHQMTVSVSEPNLVLVTETPNGSMKLTLQRHGDDIMGSWTRGLEGGDIKGSKTP